MALWFKKRTDTNTTVEQAAKPAQDTSVSVKTEAAPKAPAPPAAPESFEMKRPAPPPPPVAAPAPVAPAAEPAASAPVAPAPAPAAATPVVGSPVLKSVAPKKEEPAFKVTVADKSDAAPAKTEAVAADMPAVPRGDPKALYYQLMNGLYDVILVLDNDGHVIDCNTRAEQIFGYSPDDVWNMPIEKMVFGMNSRMFSLLKKNLGSKRHILIDARCFRSNGTSFLAEIGVSTIQLTRSGNVVFAIRNVERRKSNQEEVRRLRAILDIIPVPAFTCSLNGSFEVMNPAVLKIMGMVDEMEAQKKNFSEVMPEMAEQFQAALMGEEVQETRQMTRPDGSTYTLTLHLRPIRKGQEITGIVGTMNM